MTQSTSYFMNCLVGDNDRARAAIKYELSQMERYLEQCIEAEYNPEELHAICGELIKKYQEYLQLIANNHIPECILDYQENDSFGALPFHKLQELILNLKQQLVKVTNISSKSNIINQIIAAYTQLQHVFFDTVDTHNKKIRQQCRCMQQLFKEEDLSLWLLGLVDFWNQEEEEQVDFPILFSFWSVAQRQLIFDFFAKPQVAHLINVIFFYKLHPELLFKEVIHPEKLISVRMRLGYLAHHMEALQKQLSNLGLHYGLQPEIDHLFHDELPAGVVIEVDEDCRIIIQSAIKELKIRKELDNENRSTLENVHELRRAYKFWFNPNNLIDAVMLLQQRLIPSTTQEGNTSSFHQEMITLYQKLSTTECLDLYGYFSNKDTRYLLYTLLTINKGHSADWLPPLEEKEKKAIMKVFQALQCVMEALRAELKNRHVTTEPYAYDLAKQKIQAGRRIQKAIIRIVDLYSDEMMSTTRNELVEQLFRFMEKGKPR